jgi:hypothetical protein
VALLHKKLQEAKAKQLQEAKAQQLNMVLAGNIHTQNNESTSNNEGLTATPNVSSLVKGVGSLSNSLIADNKVKTIDGEPYRYSNVIPLLPGDVLGMDHYSLLYHFMELYFEIDKDSEVICPGDSRYELFIRIHTFDFEAKNAITEFNALMDIVYVPEDITDNQDRDTRGIDDDTREDDIYNVKVKDKLAAITESIAEVQTDSKAAQGEDDVSEEDEGSPSLFGTNVKQVKRSLYFEVSTAWYVCRCVIDVYISFIK